MEHFNKLTPAEAERLAILAEECAEVIQIVGKILRHGYESHSPYDPTAKRNRHLLEHELGDVQAIIGVMKSNDDVDNDRIIEAISLKRVTLRNGSFTHHQS